MTTGGLTHGGFYGHFKSKDALAAEACSTAFAEGLDRVGRDGDLAGYVARYFTKAHRDRANAGCPMVALGSEITNQDAQVQEKFAEGVAAYIAGVEQLLRRTDGNREPAAAREQAITTVAALVGGMILARATAQAQPELSAEILPALPPTLCR